MIRAALLLSLAGFALAGFAFAYHNAKPPLDPRDPRCDTAARYEAMREGADCNIPMTEAEKHYGCRFAEADKNGGECS